MLWNGVWLQANVYLLFLDFSTGARMWYCSRAAGLVSDTPFEHMYIHVEIWFNLFVEETQSL